MLKRDYTRRTYLKIFYHTPPDRSAAFRLPKDLLKTLNEICAELDCNRSQLIRRQLKDYIRFHELDRRKQEE
jgi:hypothetical protein